jgi:hypothetical protein
MVLAHRARRKGDEVITVVNIDEVIEFDVTARRLPVNKTGEIVCERHSCFPADLSPGHGRGIEPHMLLATVYLNDDVNGVGMGGGTLLFSFRNNEIVVHYGLLSSIIFIETMDHKIGSFFFCPSVQ